MQLPRNDSAILRVGGSIPGSRSSSTSEKLPLTPQMIDLLRASAVSARSTRKRRAIIMAAGILAAVVLTRALGFDWDLVVLVMCALLVIPLPLDLTRLTWKPFVSDIETGTFLRLAGLICLSSTMYEDGSIDYYFRLEDENFSVPLRTFNDLRQVDWASVDIAPYSCTMFTLRGKSGEILWRHPSYVPETTVASPGDA